MPDEYRETREDARIKYGGCYVRCTGLEDKFAPIVKLGDQISVDRGRVSSATVTGYARTPKNLTTTHDFKVMADRMELTPLRLGNVNLAKSVIILQSIKPEGHAKYRRLPNEHSIRIHDPFKAERDFLELRPVTRLNNYFVLKAWGENHYPSAPAALQAVMNHERLGYAFTADYFFGISLAGDGIFLYKSGRRVARVNEAGEVMLKPKVVCLKEQLSEFGLNVKEIEK